MIANKPFALLPFLLTTVAGSGCLRPAPGTWGSVAAGILLLPVVAWVEPAWWPWLLWLGTLLWTLAGLACCPWAIGYFGRGDPSQVVIDEAAGVWLCVALLSLWPNLLSGQPYATILTAVLAFRVFDVAKPWPVSRVEALPGGWGIMLDDLVAAIPAAVCAWLVSWLTVL